MKLRKLSPHRKPPLRWTSSLTQVSHRKVLLTNLSHSSSKSPQTSLTMLASRRQPRNNRPLPSQQTSLTTQTFHHNHLSSSNLPNLPTLVSALGTLTSARPQGRHSPSKKRSRAWSSSGLSSMKSSRSGTTGTNPNFCSITSWISGRASPRKTT